MAKWNCATDPVWLDDVQAYPNAGKKQALIRVALGNITGKAASGRITVGCASYNVARPSVFKTQSLEVNAAGRESVIEFTYEPGEDVPLGAATSTGPSRSLTRPAPQITAWKQARSRWTRWSP